ncbi:formyltransferase family protein [Enterovibrio norvegicus]|uniref:formyltransferase family protein n=1 Tax=Enterovibrio norvegicus TaxID=188144 RepID=UPI0013D39109|nr:formyltransferase family protein [Enterovibrio norvegicus]
MSTKIALFIIDDSYILSKVSELANHLDIVGINKDDIKVFCKSKKLNKSVEQLSFIEKLKLKKNKPREIYDSLIYRLKRIVSKKAINNAPLGFELEHIDSINSDNSKEKIKDFEPDVGIFIYYDEIVKKETLALINKPFNIHPAHLPDYRGCQPIYWLLKNKVHSSTVTLHVMTDGIDEGDIVYEYPYSLSLEKSIDENVKVTVDCLPEFLAFSLRRIARFKNDQFLNQDCYLGESKYYGRPNH